MRAIFISYRREDSPGEAGRLFDDLVSNFGETSVFMDVDAIEVGRDFRKAIDESVATCGVLLAIIGKDWLHTTNAAGKLRLEDPTDFVRLEIAAALKRDIPVIPVLVRGAIMPQPEQLPSDLTELAYRNGVELTHARWRSDLQLLIKALERYVGGDKTVTSSVGTGTSGAAAGTERAALRTQDAERLKRQPETPTVSWWKTRWTILALLLISVIAITVYVLTLGTMEITVPDVTGSNFSDALARLEAEHLTVGAKTFQLSAGKPPNTIVSQSPAPGANVKRGTAVDLVLAQLPTTVKVPTLVSKSRDAAEQLLRQNQLTVGNVSRISKSDIGPGIVVDQVPKSGNTVAIGTAVDLVLSQTPTTSKQPTDLTGMWRDEDGYLYKIVSAQDGWFDMDRIKPPETHASYHRIHIDGREIEITIGILPSGTMQAIAHMQLSVDGNIMSGYQQATQIEAPPSPWVLHRQSDGHK